MACLGGKIYIYEAYEGLKHDFSYTWVWEAAGSRCIGKGNEGREGKVAGHMKSPRGGFGPYPNKKCPAFFVFLFLLL